MSKKQSSHSVRAAAHCCSQRVRNVTSPLSPLGRIARIVDSNCPSRQRELHNNRLWRGDGGWPIFASHHCHGGRPIPCVFCRGERRCCRRNFCPYYTAHSVCRRRTRPIRLRE